MSTANVHASTAARQRIEERLDAIDRALLGLLPRSERLAMVAQVEARIGELAASGTDGAGRETPNEEAAEEVFIAPRSRPSVTGRVHRSGNRRLSRLAMTAGILGMLALVLLLFTPVTYFMVAFVAEAIDEVAAVALLGGHTVGVAFFGLAAVALGIFALVRLARRSRNLWGHGWAITGLCTGPLPMLAGGVVVLITGLQLFGTSVVRVEMTNSNPAPVNSVAPLSATAPVPEHSSVKADDALNNGQAEPARFESPAEKAQPNPQIDCPTHSSDPSVRTRIYDLEAELSAAPCATGSGQRM